MSQSISQVENGADRENRRGIRFLNAYMASVIQTANSWRVAGEGVLGTGGGEGRGQENRRESGFGMRLLASVIQKADSRRSLVRRCLEKEEEKVGD